MLKRDISLKYEISFEKPLCIYKVTIPINKTYLLSQDHVHHKTNNTTSSQVNKHINILEHTIEITLSLTYNVNSHV